MDIMKKCKFTNHNIYIIVIMLKGQYQFHIRIGYKSVKREIIKNGINMYMDFERRTQ